MTQYGYEPLSPDDSGSTLLERINGVVAALVTNHKGPARPGYVQPGMMWIDDSGSEWLLNLYDGASDVAIAAIDPATHQALSQWVPETRTIASGLGVKINGGESATLAGTVTVGLDLATPAETIAGQIGNKPAAPDGVHAAIAAALAGVNVGLHRRVTSGLLTLSAGGLLTWGHGLGAQPTRYWATLVCQTAELGYAVGEEIEAYSVSSTGTSYGSGIVVRANAANVTARVGSNFPGVVINGSNGVGGQTLSMANWKVRLWAEL